MNKADLKVVLTARVLASPDFSSLVVNRNDMAIADAVNALGLTRSRVRLMTNRGIYTALGKANGAAVMNVLNSLAVGNLPAALGGGAIPAGHALLAQVPVFADLVPWLRPGCEGLDFGSADLQETVTALAAAGLFTSTQAAALLALGREPDTVSVPQISDALNEGL